MKSPSIRNPLLLISCLALVLAACQTGAGTTDAPTTVATADIATTSTASTLPTTITLPPSTEPPPPSPEPPQTAPPEAAPPEGAEVTVPDGTGPFPTVVLVHGGGWLVGDISSMADLADFFATNGYLAVNTTYQLSIEAPGFPTAIEDVSCAVSYARGHPLGDGTVVLVGHSAGAHISALVALTGSDYDDECAVENDGVPERFVGLAGPYDTDRVGPLMFAFFGQARDAAPEIWDAGNPHNHVAENPDVGVLLLHGDEDFVVDVSFSERLHSDLGDAGINTTLQVLEGVDHPGARDPDIVGSLILTWLGS